MKKVILLAMLFAASFPLVADASMIYTTRCGIKVQTVSPDFFATQKEADEFYAELDEIYCGKLGGGGSGLGQFIDDFGTVAP